jgi:hypothetical protein
MGREDHDAAHSDQNVARDKGGWSPYSEPDPPHKHKARLSDRNRELDQNRVSLPNRGYEVETKAESERATAVRGAVRKLLRILALNRDPGASL